MSLRLIPPGRRKGNRTFIARGRIAGRLYEITTDATDQVLAEKFAADFVSKLLAAGVPPPEPKAPPRAKTFLEASAAYKAWANPDTDGVARLKRLEEDALGGKEITAINNSDLVATADRLYPTERYTASSRNRKVITPASSVLHYAAEQGWCSWLRIRRFKEPKPLTRALRREPAEELITAAKRLKLTREWALLEFLFFQGLRIGDTLAVIWERVDLDRGVIEVRISKTNQWRWKALHPRAKAALASLAAPAARYGSVFPWANRWAVYKALEPITAAAGVPFTPHVARHSLGTWLAGEGVSLKTRMAILDHADPKSNVRYEMSDIPEQQTALGKVGLWGKNVGKKRKPAK